MNDATFEEIMKWEESDNGGYLQSMDLESTWGGAIEIKAFVNLFNVNVFVHIPHVKNIVEFVRDEQRKDDFPTVHILWTGNHFVSLQPTQQPQPSS